MPESVPGEYSTNFTMDPRIMERIKEKKRRFSLNAKRIGAQYKTANFDFYLLKEIKPRSRDDNLLYSFGKKVAFKTSVIFQSVRPARRAPTHYEPPENNLPSIYDNENNNGGASVTLDL